MDQWSRKFAHLSATAVTSFGMLAWLLFTTAADPSESNLPQLLFLCGAVGAVVANYQRLSKLSQAQERVEAALALKMVTIQLYISPLIGGVFALVLWAAFFSGLLGGDFFPRIEGTDTPYKSFHELMSNTRPETFADAMKGVFWSFIAGYSERFVPNILDKLAEKADG